MKVTLAASITEPRGMKVMVAEPKGVKVTVADSSRA